MSTPKVVLLPDPYTMDWRGWADVVAGYNPALSGEVDPNEPWRQFAARMCQALPGAPMPDRFGAWQDWAAAVRLALGL